NVILLANNHIMDYGIDGCEATIKAFDGITTVGVGKSRDAFSAKYVEVKGRKIGFISLVQNEFGVVKYKDDDSYGAAWVNSPDVVSVVKEAKSQCDCLLVFPHAGVEHTAAPLPEWRKIYKNFIDLGADAVIASHPHCPQGWEYYKGKPIYYSLGDFYFDELTYDDLWYKSIVVELNIGDTIEAKEHFVCFNDKTGIIEIDKSERMREHVSFANHLLKNEKEYNEYIDEMCAKHWMGIKYGLLRGVCGVSLKMRLKYIVRLLGCMILGDKDEMYLLNALQCESHRWVMERYLRNNNIK
ncbi:MAG: CapA family protein, partial [Alphaproteobacteria bacterium]|nr:CapA family protein [Alphaproteobacteria bacterium]